MADGERHSSSSSVRSPIMCKCGDEAVLLMSHSKNNPKRKFWRCPHWNEDNGCKFFQWVVPVSECETTKGNWYEDELHKYVVQIEELKERLSVVMTESQAYVREIDELKKKIAKEEENCHTYLEQILQLKMKVGRQQVKIGVERNRVKMLCFVTAGLWVFVTLLSILIAMNVGGARSGL